VNDAEMRRRVAEARVGRLATVTSAGRPHVVPCCFALDLDATTIYSAVDAKPKSTLALRRLANLRATPFAAVLVDHYTEDWAELWWVRVDGHGRIVSSGPERDQALTLLSAKYDQYGRSPPPGPVIAIDVTGWRRWP
jgi:PPOX class probable F420-dependent enzyme